MCLSHIISDSKKPETCAGSGGREVSSVLVGKNSSSMQRRALLKVILLGDSGFVLFSFLFPVLTNMIVLAKPP